MEHAKFRVVIVGGSIAGLTLAHCLHKAGIDYIVLEKREEIAPQEGASVGVMPNGARILQQLGLYDSVSSLIEPLNTAHVCYPDGFLYTSQYPRLLQERFGYPLAFLDRQKLLQILYLSLPDRENKVRKGESVVSVNRVAETAFVQTSDGNRYEGDLVVGADGVHSMVRKEMWRIGTLASPGLFEIPNKQNMTAEYACVFGISAPYPKLTAGQQITRYNDGWSILSIIGKDGRTFWFLMLKLDQEYVYGNAPRFTADDALRQCEKFCHEPFWGDITFGDIFRRREMCTMTPLEETVFQRWHWENIVCIGDSMHKIAPHTGQGANCAMEDAAALTNMLRDCLKADETPSGFKINQLLDSFTGERVSRMKLIYSTARLAMRLHARDGFFYRVLGRYYLPYTGDTPANKASEGIAGGACLNFLPIPCHSASGWVDFKGKMESQFLCLSAVIGTVGFALCMVLSIFFY